MEIKTTKQVYSKLNGLKQSTPKNREVYHSFLENLQTDDFKNERSIYEHLDTIKKGRIF